jgi:hypothetical protein
LNILDPNDPEDRMKIAGYLIDDEIDILGVEEALTILYEHRKNMSSQKTISLTCSQEELDFLLTEFHFSQQVLFDFYEVNES